MSELTLTVLRLGFLVLLWTFVLTLAGVMRSDLFGPRVTKSRAPKPARQVTASKAAKGSKSKVEPARQRPRPDRRRGVAGGHVDHPGDHTDHRSVGRADCTVVIDDDYASNHHARDLAARVGLDHRGPRLDERHVRAAARGSPAR